MIEGVWFTSQGRMIEIHTEPEKTITWSNGNTTEYIIFGHKLQTVLDGDIFQGTLESEKTEENVRKKIIKWSDGDIWRRVTSPLKKSSGTFLVDFFRIFFFYNISFVINFD